MVKMPKILKRKKVEVEVEETETPTVSPQHVVTRGLDNPEHPHNVNERMRNHRLPSLDD